MQKFTANSTPRRTHREASSPRFREGLGHSLMFLLLTGTLMLCACGGGSSSSGTTIPATLSGNWQFTMAAPADGSFSGGLLGGFLSQTGSAASGAANYAVSLPQSSTPCNSGSAQVTGMMTGTLNGQDQWSITAVAGTQTFTFAGTLSLDGSTIAGTYSSTAGTASDGSACGTAQSGLQWSAALVPPLTGSIQGSFHSAGGAAGLNEQEFLVSGALIQGATNGANAAVTGNLNFLNYASNKSDYPCFTSAAVSGQISGDTVSLQLNGTGGTIGLIGETTGSNGAATGLAPVFLTSAVGGFMLSGAGPSYLVANGSGACAGSLVNISSAGDYGNLCLALNSTSACQQPLTLAPAALSFPSQTIGAPPAKQTITLTNNTSALLSGLTLALTETDSSGVVNFSEKDTCGANGTSAGTNPFSLGGPEATVSYCTIAITFDPCPAPNQCTTPLKAAATLSLTSPSNDMILTLPITGTGVSSSAVSPARFDSEGSVSQPSAGSRRSLASPGGRPTTSVPDFRQRTFQDSEHHADIQ
jgi:hypothetical protein